VTDENSRKRQRERFNWASLEKKNAEIAGIGGDQVGGSELDMGQICAAYEERI